MMANKITVKIVPWYSETFCIATVSELILALPQRGKTFLSLAVPKTATLGQHLHTLLERGQMLWSQTAC